MNKPRVAIVTPGTFEVSSETSSSVEQVVREVCARLKETCDFYIFSKTSKGLPRRENRNGIVFIRVPFRTSKEYLRQVSLWIRRLKIGLIQVENRPRFVPYLKKSFPRLPVWLRLHSLTFVTPPFLSSPQSVRCLSKADAVIANSQYLKGELTARSARLAAKIDVHYLGVDPDRFESRWEPQREAERERELAAMGYAGRKVILYAGRFQEIKGVHHILEAMPDIVRDHPEALLLLVGGAYYGSDRITPYVERLHRLGNRLPGHVRFIPFVPHDDIPRWFRLADAVVVPSFEKEAFGLVAVEAMASGVPVLATRAGGLTEVVEHERSGFLIEPEHLQYGLAYGIHRLFSDPELLKRMGHYAAERVRERFTWTHTAEEWLRMYRLRRK